MFRLYTNDFHLQLAQDAQMLASALAAHSRVENILHEPGTAMTIDPISDYIDIMDFLNPDLTEGDQALASNDSLSPLTEQDDSYMVDLDHKSSTKPISLADLPVYPSEMPLPFTEFVTTPASPVSHAHKNFELPTIKLAGPNALKSARKTKEKSKEKAVAQPLAKSVKQIEEDSASSNETLSGDEEDHSGCCSHDEGPCPAGAETANGVPRRRNGHHCGKKRSDFATEKDWIKYRERRARNNRAAIQSRQRKRDRADQAIERADQLEKENEMLELKISSLTKDVVFLRTLLLKFVENGKISLNELPAATRSSLMP